MSLSSSSTPLTGLCFPSFISQEDRTLPPAAFLIEVVKKIKDDPIVSLSDTAVPPASRSALVSQVIKSLLQGVAETWRPGVTAGSTTGGTTEGSPAPEGRLLAVRAVLEQWTVNPAANPLSWPSPDGGWPAATATRVTSLLADAFK